MTRHHEDLAEYNETMREVQELRAEVERLTGLLGYSEMTVRELQANNGWLRAALKVYRQAQRWATGTEEHRLALQAADKANPLPPYYEVEPKP